MRTTVELSDRNRAKLLELAGERGEKGFSRFVNEAVEQYLKGQQERRQAKRKILELMGSLANGEAPDLRQTTASIRDRWR